MIPLSERLKQPKPLLYDGGFGSQLFARGIELPNSSVANELHPEDVVGIHCGLYRSRSRCHRHQHLRGVHPAPQDGRERPRRVRPVGQGRGGARQGRGGEKRQGDLYRGLAGTLPGSHRKPTAATPTFGIANHLVRDAHRRLADALAEGGVDFFCIETMFSAREASIAADVARQYGLPVAVNLTYKYTQDRRSGKVDLQDRLGTLGPRSAGNFFRRASCRRGTIYWSMWICWASTAAPNPGGRNIRACPMPSRGSGSCGRRWPPCKWNRNG